jgi:hypothetical protein
MDTIISMLVAERDRLTRAIEALQGPTKRRGRPPKVLANVTTMPKPARKKRTFTAAQRKAVSIRIKKYWAAKRKAA